MSDQQIFREIVAGAEQTISALLTDIIRRGGWSEIEIIVTVANLAAPAERPKRFGCRATIVGKL